MLNNEIPRELKEVYVARMLSVLKSSQRKVAVVEFDTYMALMHLRVPRLKDIIEMVKDVPKVLYVQVDRQVAIDHLKAEYNLYD